MAADSSQAGLAAVLPASSRRVPRDVYVGPRPFAEGETLYGRDRETVELTNLLIGERLVLLCAPSGAGKTSLVQAKLIPAMRAEDFTVAPVIRPGVEATAMPGANRYLLATLLKLEESRPKMLQLGTEALADKDLDTYLNERYATPAGGADAGQGTFRPLLLVFDQFEEVLTADPADDKAKREFFGQLGRALRDRNRWALFAIREDHAVALDPYLRLIPTRLSATYRLDFLRINDDDAHGADEVLAAIRNPAAEAGVEFAENAARALVEDLRQIHLQQADASFVRRSGPSVEPVHLQVVCRELWECHADPAAITLDDLQRLRDTDAAGSESGVDVALARYYDKRVRRAAEEGRASERRLRNWCGQYLISPQGVRRSLLSGEEKELGVTAVALAILKDAYLVRAEQRRGALYYELAHDRLIQPVRRANAAWRKRYPNPYQEQAALWRQERERRAAGADELLLTGEALKEFEQWGQQHEDELEELQDFLGACRAADRARNKQWVRWLTLAVVGASILLAGAVASTVWALIERQRANANEHQAQEKANQAGDHEREATEQRNLARIEAYTVQTQALVPADPHEAASRAIKLLRSPNEIAEAPAPQARKSQEAEMILRDALAGLGRADRLLPGQAGAARVLALSPDEKYLAAGGYDGAVRVWTFAGPQRTTAEPATAWEFKGSVTALALAEVDGRALLLAGGEDGNAVLLELGAVRNPGGAAAREPPGERDPLHLNAAVTAVATSSQGLFALGCADGTALVWDWRTGRTTRLAPHSGSVIAVVLSPNPLRVFTGGTDGVVRASNVADGRAVQTFNAGARITALAIGPTAEWFAVGTGKGGYLHRMSPATKQLSLQPELLKSTEDEEVSVLGFSGDNRWCFLGTSEGDGRLYDLARGPDHAPTRLVGHTGRITSFAFDSARSAATCLVTGSLDGTARRWSLADPGQSQLLRGHTGPLTAVALSQAALVTSSVDGTVRAWDMHRLSEVALSRIAEPRELRHTGSVAAGAFRVGPADATDQLVTSTTDRKLFLWRLDVNRAICALPDPVPGTLTDGGAPSPSSSARIIPYHLALDRRDQSLVVAYGNGLLFRWGQLRFDKPGPAWDMLNTMPQQNALAQPPTRRADAAPWKIAEEIRLPGLAPTRATARSALSADARRYARARPGGKQVQVWDLTAPGQEPPLPIEVPEGTTGLAFGPGNDLLALRTARKVQVRPIDPAGHVGAASRELDLQWVQESAPKAPGRSRRVAFSDDGGWLATDLEGGRIALWKWKEKWATSLGSPPSGPAKANPDVSALTFAHDGQRLLLVGGYRDGTIRLWDVKDVAAASAPEAPPPVVLRGHDSMVTSLAVSKGGRYLLSTSTDGTARVWALALDLLVERARELIEDAAACTPPAAAPAAADEP